MHPALNIAIKAARRAGQIINRASNDLDLLKVSTKQPNDFVTEVDQAAEAAIIATLQEAYPQVNWKITQAAPHATIAGSIALSEEEMKDADALVRGVVW